MSQVGYCWERQGLLFVKERNDEMENELSRRDVIAGVGAAAAGESHPASEALAAEPKAGSPLCSQVTSSPTRKAPRAVIDERLNTYDMHFALTKGLNATRKTGKAKTDGNFDAIRPTVTILLFTAQALCSIGYTSAQSARKRAGDGPCGCDQGFRLLKHFGSGCAASQDVEAPDGNLA
jgi:hypothetical protein